MTSSPRGLIPTSREMTQTDDRRSLTSVKVQAEELEMLRRMAAQHCRSMSGEVSWLIRQASAQLEQETEA